MESILHSKIRSEESMEGKLAAEVKGQISINNYTQALVTTERKVQEEREEMLQKLNNTVQIIPFAIQSTGLMPVLVTITSTDPYKVTDRTSLLSYMLRKPLRPSWKLAFGRKLGLTPGQLVCLDRTKRNVLNTDSPLNRTLVNDKFGVKLPPIEYRQNYGIRPCKPVTGRTVDTLTMPPRANRLDPQLVLPPVPEADARKGIYSLIERRWIPPSAEVTLTPSPVIQQRVMLHRLPEKFRVSMVRIENNSLKEKEKEKQERERGKVLTREGSVISRCPPPSFASGITPWGPYDSPQLHSADTEYSSTRSFRQRKRTEPIGQKMSKTDDTIYYNPTTIEVTDQEEIMSRTLELKDGHLCETSDPFKAFKLQYLLYWNRMLPGVRRLAKLLTQYAIPFATILGDRLVKLAEKYGEEDTQPTLEELFDVLENKEEVQGLMFIPGRQFKGPGGKVLAAVLIQKTWRRHRDRSDYIKFKYLRGVVAIIEDFWNRIVSRDRMRQCIEQNYMIKLERFRERAREFAMSWDEIRKSERVVIHMPSLGYSRSVRYNCSYFSVRQNSQMARLCEIKDPNVEVIYVSPTSLSVETLQYYNRLLGLAGAVDSGRVEDQRDLAHRYTIIVPEAVQIFNTHRMCLASLLKYSPRTLKRLAGLIRGRRAYLVPGLMHKDDVDVADILDVPVLGSEPEVVARHCTKSGSRDIFQAAQVPVPPGVGNIFSLEQLYESVTQLVLDNMEIKLWVLKLNNEFDGRGNASCDVTSHLTCLPWLKQEAERFGDQWLPGWAQEAAFDKVLAEVPTILKNYTVVSDDYKCWDLFLVTFLSRGGVVEAYPPTCDEPSLPGLTANILLEPNGEMTLLSVGEQIHAESPLSCWGYVIPQCAMEPMSMNTLCRRVSKVCFQHGLVGYIKIDLVSFISPTTLEFMVWAIDLHIGYSDSLALSRLADYLTSAVFQPRDHIYTIPTTAARAHMPLPHSKDAKGAQEEEPRYCVMSTRLIHSNLSMLHYSVFFQLCRANGIGYDITEREGTVFTLQHNAHREQMGMITVGRSLQTALATFARHLATIHEEVSTPNMPGTSNFKYAIEDIEGILHSVQLNLDQMAEEEAERRKEKDQFSD